MEIIKQKLQQLIEASDWSVEDRNWFLAYLDKNDTSALQQLMQEYFSQNVNNSESSNEEAAKKLLEFIHQRMAPVIKPAKVIRFATWKRIAAAAAILILIGTATFFLFFNKEQKLFSNQEQIAKTNTNALKNDVAPGGNKAVLTLSDNSKIILDNAQNGMITQQGNTKVLKLDDGQLSYTSDQQLAYRTGSSATSNVLYNTLSNPRGSKTVSLLLNDGTKVWLNCESSLKYPVAFAGNERKVEITGEAYFEVAHDATKPFKVNIAGKEEVEVLGTHFNINSYGDEATINTTLLEGRVKLTPMKDSRLITHDSRLLSPGEQAQLNSSGQINLNTNPDINAVMAWKNGMFVMNRTDIGTIMRKIARWYDVDVVYESEIPKGTISGSVSRDLNLSQVLKVFNYSGVHFDIEGNPPAGRAGKIIVKPE